MPQPSTVDVDGKSFLMTEYVRPKNIGKRQPDDVSPYILAQYDCSKLKRFLKISIDTQIQILRIPNNRTIERSNGIFFSLSLSLRGGLEKRILVSWACTARQPDNLAHIHCNAYFLISLEQFNLKIQLTCRYAPIFPFFWLNVNENMIQLRLRFALPLSVDSMNYSSGTAKLMRINPIQLLE